MKTYWGQWDAEELRASQGIEEDDMDDIRDLISDYEVDLDDEYDDFGKHPDNIIGNWVDL